MNRCPRCGHDLPAPYAPARAAAYVAGVLQASYQIAVRSPWRVGLFATLESAVIIGLTVAWAIFLLRNFYIHDAPEPPQEPDDRPLRHESRMVGDNMQLVTKTQRHRRWLREKGFYVSAEPLPGALSTWLWAVHDGVNTFSQTGARTAVKDTPKVREWGSAMLSLFCKAGWATPRNGWDNDVPDVSNGVTDVDEDVIYDVARTGQQGLVEMLMRIADESVENELERGE